jgi:hypothetical protein
VVFYEKNSQAVLELHFLEIDSGNARSGFIPGGLGFALRMGNYA